MPFATEDDVRRHAFLEGDDTFTSAQIADCLAEAHREILEHTSLTDESPADETAVLAESWLALACLYSRRALSRGAKIQSVRATGVSVDVPREIQALRDLSERLCRDAWRLLAPHGGHPEPPALRLSSPAG